MSKINFSEIKEHFNLSEEYLNITIDAYEKNDNFEISNSTINHAKLLIYLLIKKATNSIDIFSGKLDKQCYDDIKIKESLTDAKKRGVEIRTIVVDNSMVSKVSKIFKELNISVKKLDKNETELGIPLDNHFMVCDENSYRIEAKHGDSIENVRAKANFNNPDISSGFQKIFNILYDNSS